MAKYEDLLKDYRSLAKKADQRLVRIEKYSEQEHYKGMKTYAYARAQKDIQAWSGGAATRFNTAPPKNVQQLQAKINDIKEFLAMPTSTKSGVTSIYKKRADTINKKYGTKFKWQDLANFFESDLFKKLDSKYGSDTLIISIGVIKDLDLSPKEIEEVIKSNIKVSDDEVVDEITKALLKQGLTSKDLFGK